MKNIIYICGDEDYLKKTAFNGVLTSLSCDEFDIHTIDMDEQDIYDIANAVILYPFMSEYNLVTVKNFRLEKLNKAEKEQLSAVLSDIPESTVLLILEAGDVFVKDFFKFKEVTDIFTSKGEVRECRTKTDRELCDILVKGAVKRGCVLKKDNAELLIRLAGNDLLVLQNELDKLCAYKNYSGEITDSDISFVSVKNTEADVFSLGENIIKGNGDAVVHILSDLLFLQTDEKLILGTLISFFADIYRLKLVENASKLNNMFTYKDASKSLYYKQKLTSRYNSADFGKIFSFLDDADRELKRSPVPGSVVLLKLCENLMTI